MTTATTALTGLQKLNAILSLLPQINGIVLNTFAQINNILPQAGLPGVSAQTLAVVTKSLTDAVTLAGDIGVEVEGLVGLGVNFATGVQGLITAIHAQAPQLPSIPAPPTA